MCIGRTHAGAYTEKAYDTQPKADRWYEEYTE